MEKFTTYEMEVEDLKKQIAMTSQTSSKIEELEQQISSLSQMASQIEALQETVSSLASSAGSSADDPRNWDVIYDMESEDEDVNWGYATGILGGVNIYGTGPNKLHDYDILRVTYSASTVTEQVFYFDATGRQDLTINQYPMLFNGPYGSNYFICTNFKICYSTSLEQYYLYILPTYRLYIKTSSSGTGCTDLSDNTAYYIKKIQGKNF